MRLLLFILTFSILSCGQNETKQKELELRERELALKEKELALKEKDSADLPVPIKIPNNKDTIQEKQKKSADTKIVTLTSPDICFGDDGAGLSFTDFSTRKRDFYEYDQNIPTITEIEKKCDCAGCPLLKGQVYSATLKFKLIDVYTIQDAVPVPRGDKEKRWVIVALKKINTPQ